MAFFSVNLSTVVAFEITTVFIMSGGTGAVVLSDISNDFNRSWHAVTNLTVSIYVLSLTFELAFSCRFV